MSGASEHISLTIVIPTLGRATLADTLSSVVPQMIAEDELIVVADDAGDWQRAAFMTHGLGRFHVHPANEERNGYAQRTVGMLCAGTATHITFMDDDDVYVDGALDAIREHAEPDIPTLFKMQYGSMTYASNPGDTLWRTQDVVYGNVGTPMLVTPNKWDKLGTWKACQEFNGKPCGGDFTFISETIDNFGGVKWVDHVIALIRPKGRQSEGNPSTS